MRDGIVLEDFEVDLNTRTARHGPSEIEFSFYEYEDDDTWAKAGPKGYRDNPNWNGDRVELAKMAKSAAVVRGMGARKPTP